MAFEGLRENLKERWAETVSKIQETSAYNNAREKFESQSPPVQKAIIFGAGALVVFFVMSFPMGYLIASQENMAIFEENRQLIEDLLAASRTAKEPLPLPPPQDQSSVRNMIERTLKDKRLVAEQIGDMQAIPGKPSALAPASVVQTGLAAQIKTLNLTQIIDLANSFGNLGPGNKLIGIDIVQSTGQTHYYDMIVRVVNFGLSPLSVDSGGEDRPRGGGNAPPKRPRAADGADE